VITSNISNNQDLAQVSQKAHLTGPKHKESEEFKKKASLDNTDQGWDKIDKDHFVFSKLQASKLGINAAAKSIRIADRAMEKIDTYIYRMKDDLQVHVKNYPPFLAGGKERIEMSNHFNAFRKLIDQLTFPPEDKTAGKIMADSSLFESDEDLGIIVEHKGFSKTIHSRQVHTGPKGLNIPELSGHATDDDIGLMIKILDFAKDTLRERRAGLSADASSIVNPPVV
jgi:hypothetical protein